MVEKEPMGEGAQVVAALHAVFAKAGTRPDEILQTRSA
jgi:hypothetical protein